MLSLILLGIFLPHTVVKRFPYPDPKCLYNWISDGSKIENICPAAIVIDVAYKNGKGTHTILEKGSVLTLDKPPLRLFACTVNQGVPSAAPDHLVHPGFKTDQYVCMEQQLVFPDTPQFTIRNWNIE